MKHEIRVTNKSNTFCKLEREHLQQILIVNLESGVRDIRDLKL
jgi:hypothetical protein